MCQITLDRYSMTMTLHNVDVVDISMIQDISKKSGASWSHHIRKQNQLIIHVPMISNYFNLLRLLSSFGIATAEGLEDVEQAINSIRK